MKEIRLSGRPKAKVSRLRHPGTLRAQPWMLESEGKGKQYQRSCSIEHNKERKNVLASTKAEQKKNLALICYPPLTLLMIVSIQINNFNVNI